MIKKQTLPQVKHLASKKLLPLEGCTFECIDHKNKSVYWRGFKDHCGNLVGFIYKHIESVDPFPNDITEISWREMSVRHENTLELEYTSFE